MPATSLLSSICKPAPLTLAQRQALWRQRKAQQAEAWHEALERIRDAKTMAEAHRLAVEALEH